MKRKPEWRVLVDRKYNPRREIIAVGYTKEEAFQDAKDSMREVYGIFDPKTIEVVDLVKF